MKRMFIGVLVAAIALTACGGDDTSDPGGDDLPIGGGPYPIADLTVTIEHPERDTVTYQITCLGDTATLTGEVPLVDQAACAALADEAVQTRLIDGPPQDVACTEQYGGPDVATIEGTIDDVAVSATVDRANGCGIADWDELLVDILPPATGV